jgi:hypothetical protein
MAMVAADVALISGPFVLVFAPILFLSYCINVLPIIVIELLIDCSPSGAMKRQARTMRENLDLLRSLPPNAPIPGWSDLRRAVDLVYPLVSAAENGTTPSARALGDVATAAGIIDVLPPSVLGALAGAAAALGKPIPKASATKWNEASSKLEPDVAAALRRLCAASCHGPFDRAPPAEKGIASPYAITVALLAKERAKGNLHTFTSTLKWWERFNNDDVPGIVLLRAKLAKEHAIALAAAKEEAKAKLRAMQAAKKPDATVADVVKATKPGILQTLLDNPGKTLMAAAAIGRGGGFF